MPSGTPAVVAEEVAPTPATIADGSTNSSTTTAVPDLTSNTSTGVASSSSHAVAEAEAWTSFDRNDGYGSSPLTYGWSTPIDQPVGWVAYQFETPIAINKYGFFGHGYAGFNYNPTNWTFEGSSDGLTWTVLGSKVGFTASDHAWHYFSVVNDVAYTHYRLNVTSNGRAGYVNSSEIKFIAGQPLP